MILFPFASSVPTATSASFAVSASYLSNIGAPVLTASLALNISGSAGATGTSINITGPTGPRGDQGPAAADGLSIYLLLSQRSTCNGCAPGTVPALSDGPYVCPDVGPGGWSVDLLNGCCANESVPY